MFGRQSVKVTYAHKRRRVHNANKRLMSSPLEVLPPDVDDLTRTQMTRRMLKRSRRAALSEQLEDKNVEHIREHLAKRIKRVSDLEPTDVAPSGNISFQTPYSSKSVHESTVDKSPGSEQLSPVPVSKRVLSRTSSKNLKENSKHPQVLASPFSSRPGSAATSPKRNGRGRSSRRVFTHGKSRTLSGVFKENSRQVSRKDSTASLKSMNAGSSTRPIKHQRYPSSPSASYMRSQFAPEDWIPPPKALSRPVDDYDEIPSPIGSVHSTGSFYVDQPQFCSTPATSRLRDGFDPHRRKVGNNNFVSSFSPCENGGDDPDVEMLDDTVSARRQIIHLSENSIFSSSDEFTLRSLASTRNDGMIVERNNLSGRDEAPLRKSRQVPARRGVIDGSQAGQSLAGSFIAEYDVPLSDSPAPSAVTKVLDLEGVPKLSVGVQPFGLPGTSPARGKNHFVGSSRKPRSSVADKPFGLPGTSPARGENLVIRTFRRPLTPPASPHKTDAPCPPSSPASDLALDLQSMDIRGNADTHSDGETCRPSAPQTRAHSLQETLVAPSAKKSVKRRHARNRAGTIRASDFAKPGSTAAPPSNVRRTRSGTVVGPDSKFAAKSTGLPNKTAKAAPATRLVAVQSRSDSDSDDELLLKTRWTADVEYLGRPAPPGWKDAEADELNLGGPFHASEPDPPRRPGLRLRRR